MDDGKIEIVGFWSSTFVSLYTCKVEAFKVFSSFVASLSAPQVEGKPCAIFKYVAVPGRTVPLHILIAYFDRITTFEVL